MKVKIVIKIQIINKKNQKLRNLNSMVILKVLNKYNRLIN
jgi:hypothetical protein